MKKFHFVTALALTIGFAAALSLVGCGGGSSDTKPPSGPAPTPGASTKSTSAEKSTSGSAATAFKGEGMGTIKGMVKLSGEKPPVAKLDFSTVQNKADIPVCEKGTGDELLVPDWSVGPNGGVANVVVWVKPPSGQYFALSDTQKKPARAEVSIDQPHCAFMPHVEVLFPSYFDGKQQTPTGQKFKVKNSAPMDHNTSWVPSKSLLNQGDNKIVPKEKGELEIMLQPCKKSDHDGEEVCSFKCTIHPWMRAYVLAIDNPFVAKTDKEGNFEIKDVPAGDLTLVYWHESFGTTPKTDKIMVKAGNNMKDLTISK